MLKVWEIDLAYKSLVWKLYWMRPRPIVCCVDLNLLKIHCHELALTFIILHKYFVNMLFPTLNHFISDCRLFTKFRCHKFCKAHDNVKCGFRKSTSHAQVYEYCIFLMNWFCVSVLHLHCRPITVFLRVPLLRHSMEALWTAVPQAEGKLLLS